MSDASPPLKSANELADDRTRLALQRTIVALDRTLLAWVRTATSLISFGFTIYKFFQQLREGQPETAHLISARDVALVMIALGVGGLLLATIDYRRQMSDLHRDYPAYGPFRRSMSSGVATIIIGLGIVGFVLVFLRQ